MKRIILFISLMFCSSAIMARTFIIVKLNTETIKIGKNRICKVGSKFKDTEEIKWISTKQDMWVKEVSGDKRELMHFTQKAFMSKKSKTPAEYLQKLNHLSTRADELPYLYIEGNNKGTFQEKRLALVIGNSNYDYLSSLICPVNDAADITDKLRNLGFDIYSLYDINYSDFDAALKKFCGTAKSYDVALIYYCGHGIQCDSQNYLVPVDAKLDSAEDLLHCIELEDIYSKLNRTSCSTKLLFIDACRNEAPWKDKREQFNEQDASGIRVVFSIGPNNFSYDGKENRNSPFAEAFLQNIGEPSPNVLLTINDIANSLMNISERMGLPAQEVHDFGSSFIDFTFVSDEDNRFEENNISKQVLINVSLLDSVFIKSDPYISKKIDYNAYMGINQNDDGEIKLGPFYDFFHYIELEEEGCTLIRPYGEYVGDYYQNDSITIQDQGFLILGEDYFTNIHHPVLDVTLVNNSESTILVNELLIDVEESYIDKNPFVIFYESGGEIYIEDRGWRTWENAKFRFSLLPDNQPFDGNYKFERTLYPTEEGRRIQMYDYFVKSGIDFPKICSSSIVTENEKGKIPFWTGWGSSEEIEELKKLLYPIELKEERYELMVEEGEEEEEEVIYIDPYLVLHGELIFDNSSRFKVGGTVRFLTSEGWGAPSLDCSRLVDVKLRNEGNNYTIKYPVSHYLKKGDVDRIAIQLDADKTSYHKFKVRLHNTNQIDIESKPIDLLIFKYNYFK